MKLINVVLWYFIRSRKERLSLTEIDIRNLNTLCILRNIVQYYEEVDKIQKQQGAPEGFLRRKVLQKTYKVRPMYDRPNLPTGLPKKKRIQQKLSGSWKQCIVFDFPRKAKPRKRRAWYTKLRFFERLHLKRQYGSHLCFFEVATLLNKLWKKLVLSFTERSCSGRSSKKGS